jgi:tRNA A-37 threonylcarbamoyl transferase component Bud32
MSGAESGDKPGAETDGVLAGLLKRHGLDDPKAVMAYQGGKDLIKPGLNNRRRTRLALADDAGVSHVLFLKRYEGPPGVLAGIRRWWVYGRAFSPAEVEARNIEAVRQAGVPTMRCLAWASGAWGSYVITTAVPGMALERCDDAFWDRMTRDEAAGAALASALAAIARKLHAAGYAHRDLYTSHVFADDREGQLSLHLIDLARVFRPRWRRTRWCVKDLAQLHYSLPEDWKRKWWDVFLCEYLGDGLHYTAPRWQHAVAAKSQRIAAHARKRSAGPPGRKRATERQDERERPSAKTQAEDRG